MVRRWSCGPAGTHIPGCTLRAPAFLSVWASRSDCSLVSLGDRTAGDAIGGTEPLCSITTHSFRTVRRSMAVAKDSTTLERRMGMTDFTTLENGGDTKNPAAEASAAKAAKPTTDMQSRTPSRA